ncbi:hypothetical protein PATSB16_23470 [Pandoraea thiooxydans]|uniref:DUF4148 domain-containing protein n=1 Tax=Pandoraea thiooxydans TaxID=445709 RepID=A0A0G3EQN9_9BURK|nr:DUF4148 domain-containing protein [Pandoraea thiooxydans]AKJ68349.1 hypothetical protein ABW99_09090 [Pandoraea thiooxydans]APR95687.1 hypothetical protein PATSB16_23470 [Pandoraea thiooxydans]
MKRLTLASALVSLTLAAAAVPAFASDAYPDGSQLAWVLQTSSVTRAQVRAELVQAEQQGLLLQTDTVYPKLADPVSTKTRAQVEQELVGYTPAPFYRGQ